MKELNWFVKTLECEFSIEVNCDQVSYEGNLLCLDEIDESLIPLETKHNLPDPLLFEMMMFIGEDGTEWIGAIAFYPDSREWLIKIILKDGEPILRKLVAKGNKS